MAAALRENGAQFSLIYVTRYREHVFDSFDTRQLKDVVDSEGTHTVQLVQDHAWAAVWGRNKSCCAADKKCRHKNLA